MLSARRSRLTPLHPAEQENAREACSVIELDDYYEFFVRLLAAIQNNERVVLLDPQVDSWEHSPRGESESSSTAIASAPAASVSLLHGGGEGSRDMSLDPSPYPSPLKTPLRGRGEGNKNLSEHPSPPTPLPASGARGASFRSGSKLLKELRSSKAQIGILTSGSTGKPKCVWHRLDSLTRMVKTDAKHAHDTWGFAYHPTHLAGLQVFFQAYVNQNPIIRLFGIDVRVAHAAIEQHRITHLSSTPTYFNLLCTPEVTHPSVQVITLGGEPSSASTVERIQQCFPQARLRNTYASTEIGSLLVADGAVFRVPEALEKLIIVRDGELAVHHSLLAESMRTATQDEFYLTGDHVHVHSQQPLAFEFRSRRTDWINVGGYKVNPHEVEAVVMSQPGVRQAHVFGKSNSVTGSIVCCDRVVEPDFHFEMTTLKQALRDKLTRYQVPQVIRVVDQIEVTLSGKKKRSAEARG